MPDKARTPGNQSGRRFFQTSIFFYLEVKYKTKLKQIGLPNPQNFIAFSLAVRIV